MSAPASTRPSRASGHAGKAARSAASPARRAFAMDRILICRTDNIGDVVLTLPLAGYLKGRFPQARIDLLCRAYVAPAMRHSQHLDNVITVEESGDLAGLFAAGDYDTVIFAFPDRRLARAAKLARVPNRVGTSHRLYHWLTCNRLAHFSRVKSDLHEAQLNFALLRALGIEHIPQLADIPSLYGLATPHRAAVDALLTPGRRHVILHPKSNGSAREWPLGHFTALARELGATPDMRLFVTGSAAEGTLLAQQAPALLALPNVENLCGKLDLDGLLALIGACDGLVACSTGPMHLSAALGRPTLGLFPPIKPIDPARWGPLGTQAEVLCAPQPCAGCNDTATCTCMQAITPQAVAARVRAWGAPAARRGAA
jgi:ADP-heptose:LPS heptosyltransferase